MPRKSRTGRRRAELWPQADPAACARCAWGGFACPACPAAGKWANTRPDEATPLQKCTVDTGAIPCRQPKFFAGYLCRRGRFFLAGYLHWPGWCLAQTLERPAAGVHFSKRSFMCILCTAAHKRAAVVRTKAFPARRLLKGRGRRRRQPALPGAGSGGFLRRSYSTRTGAGFMTGPCLYSAAWQCRL